MANGLFISFEGIEAAGKTTQTKRLAASLRSGGHQVIATREPPDGAIDDLLRQGGADYQPLTQVFLLAAARHQHIVDVIRPALARGQIVLCDRFVDSTMAYQGYGFGVERALIGQINAQATRGLLPDISFIFDLDVELMMQRLKSRGAALSSYERLGRDFYQKVRAGFLEIAAAAPERCRVLDAARSEDQLAEEIEKEIKDKINNARKS